MSIDEIHTVMICHRDGHNSSFIWDFVAESVMLMWRMRREMFGSTHLMNSDNILQLILDLVPLAVKHSKNWEDKVSLDKSIAYHTRSASMVVFNHSDDVLEYAFDNGPDDSIIIDFKNERIIGSSNGNIYPKIWENRIKADLGVDNDCFSYV